MQAIEITDQIGNDVLLKKPATKIISLVPSQSELLYDLGLIQEVVGITKFCVHPSSWRKEKTIVGGTKNHHLDKIDELKPDLILANKEENTKQFIHKLSKKYPVYVSAVANLSEAYQMMKDVGVLTGTTEKARVLIDNIEQSFQNLKLISLNKPYPEVAYCIWRDPWMWAGKDTFINHMLDFCQFKNVVTHNRYPEIDWDDIKQLAPQYVFLSSEPYPFQQKHVDELKAKLPDTNILLVDGEFFSWYGSRLLKASSYFASLLNQIKSNTL